MITHDPADACQANDRFHVISSFLCPAAGTRVGAWADCDSVAGWRNGTGGWPRCGNKVVTGKARNAEMPTQMQQVHRAEVAGKGDQVQVRRVLEEHDRSGRLHMVEADPEVGCTTTGAGMRSDQVLPAQGAVLLSYSIQ